MDEIFSEMIRTSSMESLERVRKLSSEFTMTLLEMKQAWASSRLFADRPFLERPKSASQKLTPEKRRRRRRCSSQSVMFNLPEEIIRRPSSRLEFREAIGTSSHVLGHTSIETESEDDVRCFSLDNFDNELNNENKQKQENKQNLFKTMSKLTKDIKSRLFNENPLKELNFVGKFVEKKT